MGTLGAVTFSDDMTLQISPQSPATSQRRLIGGAMVVQADATAGGRTLTLNSQSHLRLTVLDQLRALEAAAMPVTLVHHRGTFTVLILDTSEMTEDDDYADPANDPLATVSGNITMIEV